MCPPFHKKVGLVFFLIVLTLIACKLTQGVALALIVLLGHGAALKNKRGWALTFYLFLPIFNILNPALIPNSVFTVFITRFGVLGMSFVLMLMSFRSRGMEKLPFGMLFTYLGLMALTAIQGWFPMISYLKLINFAVFLMGIYWGTQNLYQNRNDVLLLRAAFLAFSGLLIWGSILTLLNPGIAYYVSVSDAFREGGLDYAAVIMANRLENEGMGLFCGILNQSQCLAPILSALGGWLVCDMLLNEKRFDWLHLFLLLPIPLLLYMTRSRIGFFTFAVMGGMVWIYCLPHSQMSGKDRGRLKFGMLGLLVLLLGIMVTSEVKNKTISRWLRKTDFVSTDTRSFGEALTASRQGTIEACLSDFKHSPLLGTGFQVIEQHKQMYQKGYISLISAPIEKGLLPLMVLSEGGIVGSFVFILFIISFYSVCMKRRYVATVVLMTTFLATNMAEATFFSPSGQGGGLWTICIIGGFVIDMAVLAEQKRKQFGILPYELGAEFQENNHSFEGELAPSYR